MNTLYHLTIIAPHLSCKRSWGMICSLHCTDGAVNLSTTLNPQQKYIFIIHDLCMSWLYTNEYNWKETLNNTCLRCIWLVYPLLRRLQEYLSFKSCIIAHNKSRQLTLNPANLNNLTCSQHLSLGISVVASFNPNLWQNLHI